MSADPIKSPTPLSEALEFLDDETERLIEKAVYSGCPAGPDTCRYCRATQSALRQRILVLIEEALGAERERILAGVVQLGEMTHVDYDDD